MSPRHFPEDAYHQHFPSADKDHFERLMDGAETLANPFLLMCGKYSREQIEQARHLHQSRLIPRTKNTQ